MGGRHGWLVLPYRFLACTLVGLVGLIANAAAYTPDQAWDNCEAWLASMQPTYGTYYEQFCPQNNRSVVNKCALSPSATDSAGYIYGLLGCSGTNGPTGETENSWTQVTQYFYAQPCTAGADKHDSNGNVRTSNGFLGKDEALCYKGCKATFQPATGFGVGAGSTYLNPGSAHLDGHVCTGGGGDPPQGPPDVSDPPPQVCSGPFCYVPPDQVCDKVSGACVRVTPPDYSPGGPGPGGGGGGDDGGGPTGPHPQGRGGAPNCSATTDAAACAGNPPPPPPNPPCGTNASPDGTGHFETRYGPTTATGYDPCVPPPNGCHYGEVMVDGQCQAGCPSGQIMINGQCVGTCPNGQTMQNGSCNTVCPNGQVLSGTTCVSSCPTGTVANGTGGCTGQCTSGQVMVNGQCQAQCPSGQSASGGGCTSTCPSGTASSGGVCQPTSCPVGQVASGGSCVAQCPPGETVQNGACASGNSASGGTDCGAPPVCSGDQVLCNIDLQDWKQNCPGKWPGDDPGDFLNSQPSDGSGAFTDGPTDAPTFDNSGFLGGSGSCVSFDPITFSAGGQGATLDLSNSSWCTVSQLLGALVLLVAYFKAAQIVLRG